MVASRGSFYLPFPCYTRTHSYLQINIQRVSKVRSGEQWVRYYSFVARLCEYLFFKRTTRALKVTIRKIGKIPKEVK